MPYALGLATKSITVLAASVSLTISPSTAKVEGTVTFSGSFSPAAPAAGVIQIQLEYPSGTWNIVLAIPYNYGDTSFSGTWVVPYTQAGKTIPCTTSNFRAYYLYAGVASSTQTLTVQYITRVRDFTAPATVAPNASFTAEGYLEYEPSAGTWQPLSGKTVSILYDGNTIGSATTGTDGKFSKTDCAIPTAGSYTLKASFAGAAALIAISILGLEVPPIALDYATYALAVIPVLAVLAVITANEVLRER